MTSGFAETNEKPQVRLGAPNHFTNGQQTTQSPVELRAYHEVSGAPSQRPLSMRVEEGLAEFAHRVEHSLYIDESGRSRRQSMWARFRGQNRRKITLVESIRHTLCSSILNVLLLFIPFAWASHWVPWNQNITFAFCFLSLIPLEKLFDFGGEQMALYTGKDLGDLIIVTLNNAVEATLAIILLIKCELRLLQATIAGVVLLHLLLVPGVGFLTGGVRIAHQSLHHTESQLNHSLLAIGVLSLLVPAAFFAASDNGTNESDLTSNGSLHNFLEMSHGMAIVLLTVYIGSRVYLHNPPGHDNAFKPHADDPAEAHQLEKKLEEEEPEVNSIFCVLFLIVTIAIMAVTAEMLVESIEHVREEGSIGEEFFGLIILPLLSFSGDGVVSILFFVKSAIFMKPQPPKLLAEDRAIDLSIQFTLFWMPLLVLLGWWTGRPLMMLFDMYEVAILIGACFLVNYVTADAKTNWAEGYIMITFYVIIGLCTWYYQGQSAINDLLSSSRCREDELEGDPLGEAASAIEKAVGEVIEDVARRAIRF